MTIKNDADEYVKDKYDQILVERKWYNYFTWKPIYKITGAGFALGLAVPVFVNVIQRRPMYSAIHRGIACVAGGTGLGYLMGLWNERRMVIRDQVVDHYMELHPVDFEVTKGVSRNYSEVLLPWTPNRASESVIPWMEKSKWSKAFNEP